MAFEHGELPTPPPKPAVTEYYNPQLNSELVHVNFVSDTIPTTPLSVQAIHQFYDTQHELLLQK